jgi:hypothetical protein
VLTSTISSPATVRPTRHERTETERFRAFSHDELAARDKASLDIFWLRDESLEDSGNLSAPELIAAEIVEDLQAAPGPVRCNRGLSGSGGHHHRLTGIPRCRAASVIGITSLTP